MTRLSVNGHMLEVNDRKLGEELNGYRQKVISLVNELLAEGGLQQIEVSPF